MGLIHDAEAVRGEGFDWERSFWPLRITQLTHICFADSCERGRLAIRQMFDKFLDMALKRIARRGVVDAGGWYIVPLFDLGLSRGLCIRGQSSSNRDHALRCGYVGNPDR
jgi:hypothetical protein